MFQTLPELEHKLDDHAMKKMLANRLRCVQPIMDCGGD